MGFRGQVHHRIGFETAQRRIHRRAIANIGLHKMVVGRIGNAGHIVQTGGIGQRIEVHDLMPLCHRTPHHRRADKACPARYDKSHDVSQIKGLSKSARAGAAASFSLSTGSPPSPQSMPQVSQRTAPSQSGA